MSRAILIIDDEEALARNLSIYLERQGYDTRVAGSAEAGLSQLAEFKPDVVLLDHNLPGITGLEAIGRIRAADASVRVVLMTGFGGIDLAVTAMKAGAADYLTKPVGLAELKLLLERLLSQQQLESTVSYYARRDASGLDRILGDAAPLADLRSRISRLLDAESHLDDTDAPAVLIHGETGTGKELVARALHYDGPRRDMPFVELNCGALPSQLIEAELFGYERGAFTDARQRKAGLVETAEGGTLFLDEIGEADPSTQVKLLKLLEDKRFRRLGGLRDQAVNVRIVSATHRSLAQMVQAGQFRADLYYRLRIVELTVPPLRERGDDILMLAQHFLAFHAQRYRKGPLRLSMDAQSALLRHTWPGNVRELRNAMEQAALMAHEHVVGVRELAFIQAMAPAAPEGPAASAATVSPEGATEPGDDLNLQRAERRLIDTAMARTAGNVTRAARLLGVSRDTLRYRLERLGLAADNDDQA
ncbi:MAG: sigma-54-dependent Fis family transcriptional regulator [Burkholderiales bacterium PBB6]|nr:MAG: sigma-54-dependent Fis family transcriptional regulator [Burkholderiales bacterium PBB6]